MATIDPIAQFNQYMQAGDFNAAGSLAASHGYTPEQVSGYLNNTLGYDVTSERVAPYMTGIAAPAAPPAPTGIEALQQWHTQTPGATDVQIAGQMQQFGVTPQQAAEIYTGVKPEDIASRFQAASPYADLLRTYQAGDVAATNAALQQGAFTADQLYSAFGLDPTGMANLRSQGYNVGVAAPEITQAFAPPPAIQPAPGEQRIVGWNLWAPILGPAEAIQQELGFEGLNKAFEWAQANKVDEAALRKTLGEDTYNKYAQQYGQGILNYVTPALADNQISAQEALDVVSQAKKFGLDASEIAKYSGLNAQVPQAFFDTYDKAMSGIVANALKPETSEVDRAKMGLALQSKYGLTDADLAKYSGGKLTEKDVTDYYAPIRSFGTDLQSKFSDPNSTAKDIVGFIDNAVSNPALAAVYGDKLTELQPQIDSLRRLADIGTVKDYENKEYDPLALMRLAGQIGQNMDTSRTSGGAFSTTGESIGFNYDEATRLLGRPPTSAEQVVFDMARSLLSKGVTDISQLKQGAYDVPEEVFEGESGSTVRPGYTAQGVFAGDKQLLGANESFGQTYTGKGATDYQVAFDENGNPKFYTTARSTSDADILAPLMMMASLAFGLPSLLQGAISSALPGAAVTGTGAVGAGAGIGFVPATAANTFASQALAGGILNSIPALAQGADFKDILKAFATNTLGAGASNLAGNFVGSMLPEGINSTIANAVKGTAGNLAGNLVTGRGDPSNILTSGIVSGLANYALDPVLQSLNLSPTELKLLTNVGIPAAFGQKVNPYSLISTLASTGKPAGATK